MVISKRVITRVAAQSSQAEAGVWQRFDTKWAIWRAAHPHYFWCIFQRHCLFSNLGVRRHWPRSLICDRSRKKSRVDNLFRIKQLWRCGQVCRESLPYPAYRIDTPIAEAIWDRVTLISRGESDSCGSHPSANPAGCQDSSSNAQSLDGAGWSQAVLWIPESWKQSDLASQFPPSLFVRLRPRRRRNAHFTGHALPASQADALRLGGWKWLART
jgi:hypothetical protein